MTADQNTYSCSCGQNLTLPADDKRFRCRCGLIYSAQMVRWMLEEYDEQLDEPYEGFEGPVRGKGSAAEIAEPCNEHVVNWKFGSEDLERIRWGYVPDDMSGRWTLYVDGNVLLCFRSWNGQWVFRAPLKADGIESISVAQSMQDIVTPALAYDLIQKLLIH